MFCIVVEKNDGGRNAISVSDGCAGAGGSAAEEHAPASGSRSRW